MQAQQSHSRHRKQMPAEDTRKKPYKLLKIVYVKSSDCFGVVDVSKVDRDDTINNLFEKNFEKIKNASFSQNKKWFKQNNLVSVYCPHEDRFFRGQFLKSPNFEESFQSIRFIDLGTVQIVPDKFIYALHQDLDITEIPAAVKLCKLAKTKEHLDKLEFLRKVSIGEVIGAKFCGKTSVSDQQRLLFADLPFEEGTKSCLEIEIFRLPFRADLSKTYCDLDKLAKI